jgi:hypothetical protein
MAYTVNQPAGVAGVAADATLLSDLSILAPHCYPDFIKKYGAENYTFILEAIGLKEKVNGQSYFHFEPFGKLHPSIKNNAAVTQAAEGDSVTLTLAAGDHWNSGTESAPRIGESVRIDSSGLEGKITAKNTGTASAHTITILPNRDDVAFASAGGTAIAAGEILQLIGDVEAGENSEGIDSFTNLTQKYENTTTEIRDDWTITDRAMIEQIFFKYDGRDYFKYKGIDESTQRFVNNREFKLMKGDIANNLTNGSKGTKGLIPTVDADGQSVQYTAGQMTISKIHEITRGLDYYGGAQEYHWLQDVFQNQELMDQLFQQYSGGGIVWNFAGGSAEVAAAYGFQSIAIDGYVMHFKKYLPFNSEAVYGRASTNSQFRNYGLLIPMKQWTDPIRKVQIPTLRVVYNAPDNGPEIKVTETGMYASRPTDNKAHLTVTQLAYCGMRVFAANQYMIVSV